MSAVSPEQKPKRKKPLRRIYRYRAYLDPGQEPEAIAAAKEVMDIYLQCCETPDVSQARRDVNQKLRHLWTPTRQLVGSWIKGVYRRQYYKAGGKDEKPKLKAQKRRWRSGVLGGFFLTTPGELTWEQILERGDKYRAQVRMLDNNEKPLAEMLMPLYSDKAKDRLRFRFLMHRPIPEEGMLQRCYLVCTPNVVNGKEVGYTWYFGISVRLPDPPLRTIKRSGVLTPSWKLEPNGSLLVATLDITDEQGQVSQKQFHLPPGTIRRARKAYGLSISGDDTLVYRNFDRWRSDVYQKMAAQIYAQVDYLRLLPAQTGVKIPGTYPAHRRYASLSVLYRALRYHAGREGAAIEIIKPAL